MNRSYATVDAENSSCIRARATSAKAFFHFQPFFRLLSKIPRLVRFQRRIENEWETESEQREEMRERNGFSIQARVIGSWRSANAESAKETVPHTLNSKPRLLESERQTKRLTSDKEADPNFLIQFANFHAPDHGSAIPIDRPFSGSFRFYIRRACVHRSP